MVVLSPCKYALVKSDRFSVMTVEMVGFYQFYHINLWESPYSFFRSIAMLPFLRLRSGFVSKK